MKTGLYTILVEHFEAALVNDHKLRQFIERKPTFLGSEKYFEYLEKRIKKEVYKDLLKQVDDEIKKMKRKRGKCG